MPSAISSQVLERFAQNSKLLALLDAKGVERLAASGVVKQVAGNVNVVKQGDVGTTFYLIATGEVRVLVAEAGDKEVARLGAGMFFGEMAVIGRQPRSATVQTTQPTQLIAFQREPVIQILRDYPRVREFLSSVGLSRSEENFNRMLEDDGDAGLADLLEGDEDAGGANEEEAPVAVSGVVEAPAEDDGDHVLHQLLGEAETRKKPLSPR